MLWSPQGSASQHFPLPSMVTVVFMQFTCSANINLNYFMIPTILAEKNICEDHVSKLAQIAF